MENEEVGATSHSPVEHQFDPMRLAILARRIVGERTVQGFCEERGLSRSLVSRILNGTLKAPPRMRSVYRFAGEDTAMADEMLVACGYPAGVVEHLRKLPEMMKTVDERMPASPCKPRLAEKPTSALSIVLDALMCRGYGDQFQIDYSRDGTFTIRLESGYNLIVIPAFATDENQSGAVWNGALQRLGLAILRNGESNKNVYFLITNDDVLYAKMKFMPNTDFQIAVLKMRDDELLDQHVVVRSGVIAAEAKMCISSFPIVLKEPDPCQAGM